MVYYRIKKEFDQKRRKDGQIYIANELYTAQDLPHEGRSTKWRLQKPVTAFLN